MSDVRARELAGRQFNRVSYPQLRSLGLSRRGIEHRVAAGSLVAVEIGVYACAPVLDDPWGRRMGATLTAPGTVLSHASAAAAWGFWSLPRHFEIVTRTGSGGPCRHGGVLVFRSKELDGECAEFRGVPITAPPRTLLDLAVHVSERALARAVREAVRTKRTSLIDIGDALGRHRGRRGAGRLGITIERYSGLPLARARSGAEIRALEILRNADCELPQLNVRIAGEEADLSWPRRRLIIEVDGGPFHLDVGEDARKQEIWEAAGWTVRRIDSDDIYAHPHLLVALSSP